MTMRTMGMLVLLLAGTARAEDQTRWNRCFDAPMIGTEDMSDHPQGRMLEGKGIEGYHFDLQRKKWVSVCRGEAAEDKAASAVLDAKVTCPEGAEGPNCTLTSSGASLCGRKPHEPVNVVRVPGFWKPDGSFDASPTAVTFACADNSPNKGQHEQGSAIAKCIFDWTYKPGTAQFLACIRASRADYCGSGLSFTEEGTPIDIYDPPPDPTQQCYAGGGSPPNCNNKGECEEAEWSEKGAVCYWHARYSTFAVRKLRKLTAKLHECLARFQAADPDHPRFCAQGQGTAVIANRSMIDGKYACACEWDGACKPCQTKRNEPKTPPK